MHDYFGDLFGGWTIKEGSTAIRKFSFKSQIKLALSGKDSMPL